MDEVAVREGDAVAALAGGGGALLRGGRATTVRSAASAGGWIVGARGGAEGEEGVVDPVELCLVGTGAAAAGARGVAPSSALSSG